MKHIFLFFGTLLSSVLFAQNHSLSWLHTFGNGTYGDQIYSIGKNGTNLITGGSFYGSNLNLSNGGNFVVSSNGANDGFLNGYNSANGTTNFNLAVGGTLPDYIKDVETDAIGNFIVYGSYTQQIDLDTSNSGTAILNGLAGQESFLAKYSTTGALLWSVNIVGKGQDAPTVLKLDMLGNSYIGFNFLDTVYPNPANLSFMLIPNGGSDICIAKYDASGNFVWAKHIGGLYDDIINDMYIHSNGNISSVGYFNDVMDFDPNSGSQVYSSLAGNAGFLWTLDNVGNYIDAAIFTGTVAGSNAVCNALDVDAAGNFYIAGNFSGTIDLDPATPTSNIHVHSGFAGFMVSLDASHAFRWANAIHFTTGTDKISSLKCGTNRFYIAGQFSQTVDMDPAAAVSNLTSSNSDAFLAAYDLTGAFIWAKQTQSAVSAEPNDLFLDAAGAIYLAGTFSGTTNFNMNAGSTTATTNSGASDAFILKLSECLQVSYATDVITTCGSYTWIDGITYTSNNNTATYALQGINQFGCDSIITLNLTITGANTTSIDTKTACDSLTWIDGITYTTSTTTPTFTIPNQAGCDSIISLHLTISNSGNGTDTRTVCGPYTWIDGNTYTTSNSTATHTLPGAAANGCDSIVTLNVTILPLPNSTAAHTACGSYTWIDGNTYNASNSTATHILTGAGANGCDSIIFLDLTVYPDYNLTATIHSCSPYTWIDGVTYSSSNNTAVYHVQTSEGCDSIVTLDLTIATPGYSVDTKTSCGPYEWIDGNVYTTNNTTATHTISGGAASGCDSIITLNLAVLPLATSTFTHSACGSYAWIDNVTYTSSNNTAIYVIPNGGANGCDSTIHLNLTIHPIYSLTETIQACAPFTWINGVTYTSSNNTATYHTLTAGGCDSLVSLNLTIPSINKNVSLSAQTLTLTSLENNATSYQWYDCINNVPVLNQTNQTFTPTQNGKYSLIITKDGCTETSDCITIAGISVKETPVIQALFPNPTTALTTITFGQIIEKGSLEIIDLSGKVLQIYPLENTKKHTFSMESYASGIYMIRINNGNTVSYKKLVRE